MKVAQITDLNYKLSLRFWMNENLKSKGCLIEIGIKFVFI